MNTTPVWAKPGRSRRRIAAVLNRQLRGQGLPPVNHKRVYRIVAVNRLLLARRYTERPDGSVANSRWRAEAEGFAAGAW